jgi:hypothetical protein
VRALFGSYSGNLYQIRRDSDGATTNIGTLTAGGYANAAAQDSFCAGTRCIISVIYDQSSQHNDLTIEGPGFVGGQDRGADASALKVVAGGHPVYGVWVDPGVGYRDNAATGTATDSQPQGEYVVVSGTHFNDSCCFDYGNTERTNKDKGAGHMDAVYFGSLCWFTPCTGSGPWVMADLEDGLFAGGDGSNLNNMSVHFPFVTALTKNNGTRTNAIKVGNANAGNLTTMYDGTLPAPYFSLVSRNSGKVLDVADCGTGDGVNIRQWAWLNNNCQQWSLVINEGSTYGRIVNRNSGKCADVQQPNTADGANVGQWACNGEPWQNWKFVDMGGGYFQIVSQNSGKCLDVQQPNTDNGANVGQWACNGEPWQLWQKVITTAPYFSLVSSNSGKVLDVADCGTGDGVNIRQWAWLNNNCQQWSFQ